MPDYGLWLLWEAGFALLVLGVVVAILFYGHRREPCVWDRERLSLAFPPERGDDPAVGSSVEP